MTPALTVGSDVAHFNVSVDSVSGHDGHTVTEQPFRIIIRIIIISPTSEDMLNPSLCPSSCQIITAELV